MEKNQKKAKNKYGKIISSIVFVCVISGILLPNAAFSFSIKEEDFGCKSVIWNPAACTWYLTVKIITWLWGDAPGYVGEYFGYFTGGIFTFTLEKLVKDTSGEWSITRSTSPVGQAFLDMWNITKQWANMIIVIGILAVALAWILNLEQYKKLLIPLLITALLVNFSIVFVGLIIDVSNILMNQFTTSGESQYKLIYALNGAWNNTLWKYPITGILDSVKYIALSSLFTIMYFAVAVSLAIFAFIFIIRYAILVILFILSPLAFAFYTFPGTKGLAEKWWSFFLEWCFIGISGAFFLNLSSKFINAMGDAFNVTASYGRPTAITNSLTVMAAYLGIALVFMIAGAVMTLQAGKKASSMVVSGARAVGGVFTPIMTAGKVALRPLGIATGAAGGAIGGAAGGIWSGTKKALSESNKKGEGTLKGGLRVAKGIFGGAIGGTLGGALRGGVRGAKGESVIGGAARRIGSNIKEGATAYLEDAGAVDPGTRAKMKQERLEIDPETKRKLDLAPSSAIREKALESAIRPEEVAVKLYAIKKLFESGKINELLIEEQEKLANYALARGADPKDLFKKTPHLAHLNTGAVNEEKEKLVGKDSDVPDPLGGHIKYSEDAWTDKKHLLHQDMHSKAEKTVRAKTYRNAQVADIREFPPTSFEGEAGFELIENTTDRKLKKALEEMSSDRVERIKKLRTQAYKKVADAVAAATNATNRTEKDRQTKIARKFMKITERIDNAFKK